MCFRCLPLWTISNFSLSTTAASLYLIFKLYFYYKSRPLLITSPHPTPPHFFLYWDHLACLRQWACYPILVKSAPILVVFFQWLWVEQCFVVIITAESLISSPWLEKEKKKKKKKCWWSKPKSDPSNFNSFGSLSMSKHLCVFVCCHCGVVVFCFCFLLLLGFFLCVFLIIKKFFFFGGGAFNYITTKNWIWPGKSYVPKKGSCWIEL